MAMQHAQAAGSAVAGRLPDWVPEAARHYLAHVAGGRSIRALAREAEVHASTVLRQVRRCEALRDDLLVDDALRDLARQFGDCEPDDGGTTAGERIAAMADGNMSGHGSANGGPGGQMTVTDRRLAAEGLRVLRRLSENGAVLAVARDMEKAVVVRDGPDGVPQRLAVVDRDVAQAMALQDWIVSASAGGSARVSRYTITGTGRQALRRLMAENGPGSGMAEAPTPFFGAGAGAGTGVRADDAGDDPPLRHMRSLLGDSPVTALARRQDKQGRPFLSRDLVAAAERLREDFELSQSGPQITQNWERFLTAGVRGGEGTAGVPGGAAAARDRLAAALADLGPGLADVALRCCCFLEGLESIEERMEWSARSGKIVLRIALQRLRRHYEETQGKYAPKIG